MKIIGITGGVGAGKTSLLSYIKGRYRCRVLLADEVAHKVKEPEGPCYEELVALLGRIVLDETGQIQKEKMAGLVFADSVLLQKVNAIIHPAVKTWILKVIEEEKKAGQIDFLFIEAALLIEAGYENIVDELWYIYAGEEKRRKRLMESRNYTAEKIDGIFASQLKEEDYKKACSVIIDNSKSLTYAYGQIDKKLGEYLWEK